MSGGLQRAGRALGEGLVAHARAVAGAGVALLVAFFCLTGWVGIDFGTHWDEWYHGAGLLKCVQRMVWLPQDFIYSGVYFLLGLPLLVGHLAHLVPAIAAELTARDPSLALDVTSLASVQAFQASATALLAGKPYMLEARTLFACLSALTIVWVYLTVLRLCPRRYYAALAGAAFVGLSWEFQYHSRILAIDAPLAQFLALEFLLFCGAWQARARAPFALWLMATGFVAGIVFGCKTTGIFALLPVLWLPLLRGELAPWWSRVRWVALGGVSFLMGAFLTSSASFLDPIHYFETMRYVAHDYNKLADGSRAHFVTGLGEHLWRLGTWLAGAVPAPRIGPALLGTGVVVVGLAAMVRRHRRGTTAWLLFLAVMLVFMGRNRLMIVRQYVMFVPFLAVAFGVGIGWLRFRIRRPVLRGGLVVLLLGAFAFNAAWLVTAALSVRKTNPARLRAQVWRELEGSRKPVRLSVTVHTWLKPEIDVAYRCEDADPQGRPGWAVIARYTDWAILRANRLHGMERVYSSHEANYDWYPSWIGNHAGDRVLRFRAEDMADLGAFPTKLLDCWPREQVSP